MFDMVVTISGVLLSLGLLSCLCCLCMKISDLRLKCYVIEMAKKKGIEVDIDKLDPKYQSPSPMDKENCTIVVPDVGIIL